MQNAVKTWKQHFSLEYKTPIAFIISQWQRELKPSIIYLVYRWLFALYFFITCILSVINPEEENQSTLYRIKWLIHITYWSYVICAVQALIVAIILSICIIDSNSKYSNKLPNKTLPLYKFYWVTNSMANNTAFAVTTIYWVFLYHANTKITIMNYLVHAVNSMFVTIDIFIVRHPIRLVHCWFSIVFAVIYAIFSAIYYAAGGTSRDGKVVIYSIIDWRLPVKTTFICIGIFTLLAMLHCLSWILYKCRIWLSKMVWNKYQTVKEIC